MGSSQRAGRRWRPGVPMVLATAVLLAACTGADAPSAARSTSTTTTTAAATPEPAPLTPAEAAYERLTPQERVGQLFVFGVVSTGATDEQLAGLTEFSAGNVFLRGHNDLGSAGVRAAAVEVARATTYAGVRPFVSADQEGGGAQSFEGNGFSDMPSGVRQGQRDPVELEGEAAQWGRELRGAGVNLNLAPVSDVVPAEIGRANAPIGAFSREYGTTPEAVGPPVAAFVRGMGKAGVATSVKHFPGIGRATGNTDSDPDVTDPTTRDDAYLAPFEVGIGAGAPMVMMSSATYPAIDPKFRACFSSVIMRDLLRGDLGFDGIIISDSFGSSSIAGTRADRAALMFFRAGGTLLLNTRFSDLEPMTAAVLTESERDPAFAETTRENVMRVLEAKVELGLVSG